MHSALQTADHVAWLQTNAASMYHASLCPAEPKSCNAGEERMRYDAGVLQRKIAKSVK